jgi:hypothetical protein
MHDETMAPQNVYLSIDPTHRIWMSEKPGYMPNVDLGDIMRCITLAVVEKSENADYPVGTHAVCFGPLVCEYFVGVPGQNVLYKAGGLGDLPLTADLSVCSFVIGLTAWHGVNKILQPDANSVVCVSGAAGAVGSLVGQLSKAKGAKVIGIAGGAQKCAWLKELGFDRVIDYKSEKVVDALAAYTAEAGQINCYFDNVGGETSDAVLAHMALNSKYALCGSISEYDDAWSGQKNFNMILMRRITVQGFICVDHMGD